MLGTEAHCVPTSEAIPALSSRRCQAVITRHTVSTVLSSQGAPGSPAGCPGPAFTGSLGGPGPPPCFSPGSPPPAPHAHHLPSRRAWEPAAGASPELRSVADTPGPAVPGPRGSTSPHPRHLPRLLWPQPTSLVPAANPPPLLLSNPPGGGRRAAASIPNPAVSRNPCPPRARAPHLHPTARAPRG